jgi:ABC-type dipeptide/oligopeptide/nickel transport system permease subunit
MTQVAVDVAAPRRRFGVSAAWRQPLAIAGVVIAVAWIVIAIFAPLIAPHDPLAQNFPASQSPSWSHLFGTDELGRDVFSRVINGSRVSLPIALVLVALAATIGSTVGAVAGYFRGVADGLLMRLADLVFAFPPIILAMVARAASAVGSRGRRRRRRVPRGGGETASAPSVSPLGTVASEGPSRRSAQGSKPTRRSLPTRATRKP